MKGMPTGIKMVVNFLCSVLPVHTGRQKVSYPIRSSAKPHAERRDVYGCTGDVAVPSMLKERSAQVPARGTPQLQVQIIKKLYTLP
jgi:hypothetical protein